MNQFSYDVIRREKIRDLQAEAQLAPLLEALQAENHRLASARRAEPRPLLVKVAPDLSDEGLRAAVSVAAANGVAGLIATNTTALLGGWVSAVWHRGDAPGGYRLKQNNGLARPIMIIIIIQSRYSEPLSEF